MKIIKKFTMMIVALLMIISVFPTSYASGNLNIDAKSAVLIEMNTGQVLLDKNADARIDAGELAKVMTLLLAAEAIDSGKVSVHDIIIFDETAFEGLEESGESQSFTLEEEIEFGDLLYCVQLGSLPEAANAVAIHVAGNVASFVGKMNDKAEQLGCTNTKFVDPHGSGEGVQYTTANDLCLIVQEALKYSDFRKIFMTTDKIVDETNMFGPRGLTTSNNLMLHSSSYFYENCTGGRMSYSSDMGYCMVSTAESESLSLIGVVLGADTVTDEDEGYTTYLVFSEMIRMFDWGIENYSYRNIISAGEKIASVPVMFGNNADSVDLTAAESISILLDNSVDIESFKREVVLYSERDGEELVAPVSTNDVLGEVSIYKDGLLYGEVKLVATSNIDLARIQYLKLRVQETLDQKPVKLTITLVILMFVLYFAYLIFHAIRKRNKNRAAAEQKPVFSGFQERMPENMQSGPAHIDDTFRVVADTDSAAGNLGKISAKDRIKNVGKSKIAAIGRRKRIEDGETEEETEKE